MAKIVVTFEDIDEGVGVNIESDVDLENLSEEEKKNLTDAQQMGLRMMDILTEELAAQKHEQQEHDCGDPACKCPHLSGQSM